MSDYKKQFDELQESINNKKLEKAKLEERLANLEKEEKQINENLKELNVSKDELDSILETLEKEIKEELEKCQTSLK